MSRLKTKKLFIKILILFLTLIIVLGVAFGIYALTVNFGTTKVTVDIGKKYQTVESFGASSAWVFQALGACDDEELKQDAIDMLYGVEGLRLNTFRYNIGAGGRESDNYSDGLRGEESFFISDRFDGDYAAFSDAGNYDFTRDKGVVCLFEKALATGNIDEVIFFANSPHYLMTLNSKTHSDEGYTNNLKPECYEAFSKYLLVITHQLYKDIICKYDCTIKVRISPINEPQWKWGGEDATQEGCHYDPTPLAEFCDVFYRTLKAYNAQHDTRFEMDIFESGTYELKGVKTYFKELAKYEWFDEIKEVSVHSYHKDMSKFTKRSFSNFVDRKYGAKKVNMSEYCVMQGGVDKSINMGIYQAKVILRDLFYLNAIGWSYWLAISNGDYEDGLVYWNNIDGEDILSVTKRYYAMKHFSSLIGVGSARIDARYSDFLGFNGIECVAFEKADGTVAIVFINDSDYSHKIKIDGVCGDVFEVITDKEHDWQIREYKYDGFVAVGAKSICTFEFSNNK